ncbi:MAG: hypothetical protein NEA02_18455 [Thermoanaerobaculia bacterium]|nr:hypothetical protein [Thermoanaerobaculia bacterium]
MRKAPAPTRFRSVASFLGLVTASVVCLCAGALVAVTYEGLPRLIFAAAGFSGYLFFFGHALRELALPRVLIERRPGPDGEVRGEPAPRKVTSAAGRNRDLGLAA